MFSRRQIYYIVVMIIVSCVTIFGCVSSPPEVTPDNFDFNIDDIELQPSDLPEGYKLSDKLLCPSIQTTLFYESYDELYEQKFGVPDKKEYQSFENPNGDNGSILYFHYKEPLPAETKVFLSGLFWGTSTKPTSEHPEEFFVSDNEIVIWCFKADSKIKKISQDKLLNVITLGTSGKTFGKTGNEWAYSVQQTSDGGFILAGYTQSYGAGIGDVWSIKTDENGNMLWNKTFGGIKDDAATSVKQTLDGGYILAGWTESYGAGNLDAWVIKIDANGNEKWNKTFGGIVDDDTSSIQQTSDGGYVLAGTTFSYGAGSRDAWFIKIDANGNEQWNKTFGGSGEDGFNSMWETSDSGYILAGGTESYGTDNRDAWIIKTDANGNELWNRTFGGINLDEAYSVQQTLDDGYILVGLTNSFGAGMEDVWLIKTDSNGNQQWNKMLGGIRVDFAFSVQQISDGGYILVGWTESYGAGNHDAWIIKTDASGNELWNRTFGGINLDEAYSVQQILDGDYVIAGLTTSYGAGGADAWLIKVADKS